MSEELRYCLYVVSRLDNKLYYHCPWKVSMEQAFEMLADLNKSAGTISLYIGDEYWKEILEREGIVRSHLDSSLIYHGLIGPVCIDAAVALYNDKYADIAAGEASRAKS